MSIRQCTYQYLIMIQFDTLSAHTEYIINIYDTIQFNCIIVKKQIHTTYWIKYDQYHYLQ